MQHEIVSRDEWLRRRTTLLDHEKALTRHRDLVSAERLRLPWVRIEKDYLFDSPDGKLSLSDLFQGRSQLYIKHFMMAPGAQHQCVGCSLEVDHMTDILPHLEHHDISYAVVARAPIGEIETVRKRMGWNSSGFHPSTMTSITISMSHSDRRTSQRAEPNITIVLLRSGWGRYKTCRAAACSTRARLARYSTHTPPMAAAARLFWESTAFSTPCRKEGTRQVPIILWLTGRDRGICIATVARSKAMAVITLRRAAAPRISNRVSSRSDISCLFREASVSGRFVA